MKRQIIIEVIAFIFFFLFIYTGLSKVYQYHIYVHDLLRSPMLAPIAYPASILIPVSEILIAALLIPDATRKYGFGGSLVLMAMFTIYVGYVLSTSSYRPCTCGGIIRQLSWKNHMIFNVIFLLLAIVGVLLEGKKARIKVHHN